MHTKANKCLHLDSNSRQAPLWASAIGLVIHSKVAAVRIKVALLLRQSSVSVLDLGLSVWVDLTEGGSREGKPGPVSGWRSVQPGSVNPAGCSEPEQSCSSLAAEARHWSWMKTTRCVQRLVSWGCNNSHLILLRYKMGVEEKQPQNVRYSNVQRRTLCIFQTLSRTSYPLTFSKINSIPYWWI